jgi:S1-C subfamily serine protease
MRNLIPAARLGGADLNPEERKSLGLSAKQLAFRQKDAVSLQAKEAGVRAGDVILGFDGKTLDMDAYEFSSYVRRHYLVGDQVVVNLIRDGKRENLTMTLRR